MRKNAQYAHYKAHTRIINHKLRKKEDYDG